MNDHTEPEEPRTFGQKTISFLKKHKWKIIVAPIVIFVAYCVLGVILLFTVGGDRLHPLPKKQLFTVINDVSKVNGISFTTITEVQFRNIDDSNGVILLFNADGRQKVPPSSIYLKNIGQIGSISSFSKQFESSGQIFCSKDNKVIILSGRSVLFKENKMLAIFYAQFSAENKPNFTKKDITLFAKNLPLKNTVITSLVNAGFSLEDAAWYANDAIQYNSDGDLSPQYNIDRYTPNSIIEEVTKIKKMAAIIKPLTEENENYQALYNIVSTHYLNNSSSCIPITLYLNEHMKNKNSVYLTITEKTSIDEVDRIFYSELYKTQNLIKPIEDLPQTICDLNVDLSKYPKNKMPLLVVFAQEPKATFSNDYKPMIAQYGKTIGYFLNYIKILNQENT